MSDDIIEKLKKAIWEYDAEGASVWAEKAIKEKIDPITLLDAITVAIRKVGDAFSRGDVFLPELVGAAEAMKAATPIIEEEIQKTGAKREILGKVAIGTVFGDIHSIGKTMVAALLRAEGFLVHDLGINVPAEEFVEAVTKYQVDIISMSALMTTTSPEQRKVIDLLKKLGLRKKVKILVGGGAIDQGFADSIGADGYDPTAPGAVVIARALLNE